VEIREAPTVEEDCFNPLFVEAAILRGEPAGKSGPVAGGFQSSLR